MSGSEDSVRERGGWFHALGNKVPEEQRQAAVEEARKMGVEASDESPWVNHIADLVEQDRPEEAIEATRVHLDLTGTYRFLAALCVPAEGGVRKRKRVPSVLVDCRDCGEPFEITSRDFDLAHEVDPDPSFRCNDCQLSTDSSQSDSG